ncbi:DUF3299 domain-containing protein [Marinobacter shengliensis]|jgi:hypothetical protein|uniref:DUF3299 domain-containing protein n=1 Tax=Marinobacter shengliensis TaxID=1389223 RepID=UPI00257409B1|nr:DUF3299 domain-containing protein [Marinobacter shengliensis]
MFLNPCLRNIVRQQHKLLALFLSLAIAVTWSPYADSSPRPLGWDELVPLGWPDRDPLDGQDISSLNDEDPEAQRLFQVLREYLDNAPVVETLHGQTVEIPGYVVPLRFKAGTREVQEFLLVPFYGACIHVPPPASNQIVLVDASNSQVRLPDNPDEPVRVVGKLRIDRSESELAVSSYQLSATVVSAYKN